LRRRVEVAADRVGELEPDRDGRDQHCDRREEARIDASAFWRLDGDLQGQVEPKVPNVDLRRP
jgi:hypothetical protein